LSHFQALRRLVCVRRHRIVIVGGGFAGVWAAMGAARLLRKAKVDHVAVTLVSPREDLVIRPRLYEADLSGVCVPLSRVLSPVGVEHRHAAVEHIDVDRRQLTLRGRFRGALDYDQLVLCGGSEVRLPPAADGVHLVDSYERAAALQEAIAGVPPTEVSVCLVEQAASVAPEFGSEARTAIKNALESLGVETRTGVPVSKMDGSGATLANGERIDSSLVVCAIGPRANALNEQLGLELDKQGRLMLDSHLATGIDGVWAAGDSARVFADREHVALMSCQHAIPQGRQAGENAAASILGRSLGRYAQPLYLTCLDLGSAGAILTRGFERDTVIATGARAKQFKRFINRSYIYPPASEDVSDLLRLGKRTNARQTAATIQQMMLRSNALRSLLIARSEDRAAQYSSA
jgi:NADH dehydrogenase